MTDPSNIDPRSIKIRGEFTSDPNLCNFIVDRPVLEDWTLIFRSADEALGSPLMDELFAVEGVAKVQVSGERVIVTKNIDLDWPLLARNIVPAIRRGLTSGGPAISAAAIEAVQSASPADLEPRIEELFAKHINPALDSHGGWVKLIKVEDRDVFIEMGGGCQGCSASQMTLRNGIESSIREIAPSVREVHDVTDHAAGANPYYT